MRIWKVKNGFGLVAYVRVAEGCKIFDTSYAALQMVRNMFPDDRGINGTQLLDIAGGEKMISGIPIYQMK